MLTDNNLLHSFILFRNAQRQQYLCFCTCKQNGFIHTFQGI